MVSDSSEVAIIVTAISASYTSTMAIFNPYWVMSAIALFKAILLMGLKCLLMAIEQKVVMIMPSYWMPVVASF